MAKRGRPRKDELAAREKAYAATVEQRRAELAAAGRDKDVEAAVNDVGVDKTEDKPVEDKREYPRPETDFSMSPFENIELDSERQQAQQDLENETDTIGSESNDGAIETAKNDAQTMLDPSITGIGVPHAVTVGDFGWALAKMVAGHTVTRALWRQRAGSQDCALKLDVDGPRPHIMYYNPKRKWVPWTPYQPDILAEDWILAD